MKHLERGGDLLKDRSSRILPQYYFLISTHFKVWIVEECLEVGHVVEAEVVVGDNDGSGVSDHTPGVSHEHPTCRGLHISLIILQGIVLGQTPEMLS